MASTGAHQASFAHNANVAGAIQLVAPDGKIFRSHVIGIAVYDPKTGDSELIAQLKDSVGELHPPNVVIYPEAFTDTMAMAAFMWLRRPCWPESRRPTVTPTGFIALPKAAAAT